MTLVINCFLQLNIAYLSSILTTPYVDTPIQLLFCMKSLISSVPSQLIATSSDFFYLKMFFYCLQSVRRVTCSEF